MDIPVFSPTCDGWALKEAGVSGYEGIDRETGANFYAAMCPLYRSNLLEIMTLEAPPSPPPLPAPPLSDRRLILPVRIFFAGGYHASYLPVTRTATGRVVGSGTTDDEMRAEERDTSFVVEQASEEETEQASLRTHIEDTPYIGRRMRRRAMDETSDQEDEYVDVETSDIVIRHCSDDDDTLCQTAASDQTWIKLDLGRSYQIIGVEILLMRTATSPPSPPPPMDPPDPPPSPYDPPFPHPPSPPPPSPHPTAPPPCLGYAIACSQCYHNLVRMTNNGVCDDGGKGSTTSLCRFGFDTGDCPIRCSLDGPDASYNSTGDSCSTSTWLSLYNDQSTSNRLLNE